MFDLHPPFQIDGNFGATSGIAEMLLQSHNGELHVLPALPSAWPSGQVQGLRGRGGYTVGAKWGGGQPDEATVRFDRDGTVKVRGRFLTGTFTVTDTTSGGTVTVTKPESDAIALPGLAGRTYRIVGQAQQQQPGYVRIGNVTTGLVLDSGGNVASASEPQAVDLGRQHQPAVAAGRPGQRLVPHRQPHQRHGPRQLGQRRQRRRLPAGGLERRQQPAVAAQRHRQRPPPDHQPRHRHRPGRHGQRHRRAPPSPCGRPTPAPTTSGPSPRSERGTTARPVPLRSWTSRAVVGVWRRAPLRLAVPGWARRGHARCQRPGERPAGGVRSWSGGSERRGERDLRTGAADPQLHRLIDVNRRATYDASNRFGRRIPLPKEAAEPGSCDASRCRRAGTLFSARALSLGVDRNF